MRISLFILDVSMVFFWSARTQGDDFTMIDISLFYKLALGIVWAMAAFTSGLRD